MKKKLLSMLSVVLMFSLLPSLALAEEATSTTLPGASVDGVITLTESGTYTLSAPVNSSIVIAMAQPLL